MSSKVVIVMSVLVVVVLGAGGVGGGELVLEVEDLARGGGTPASGGHASRSSKNSAISACQRALTSVASMAAWAASRSGDLDVADEQAVGREEERVVVPAGVGQRLEHLGPDGGVPLAVLLDPLRA